MASHRQRSAGSWEFVIKRKGLLPKPITLTFDSEMDGIAYCAHLEKLLDAGIVPDEFKVKATKSLKTIKDAVLEYIAAVHITDDDVGILGQLKNQVGDRVLDKVDYKWAESWIKDLQVAGGAPSTIRKKVGALARCLDWVIRRSDSLLIANPLRILPKRYATTSTGRKDVERDRRLRDGEEKRIVSILNKDLPEGRHLMQKLY
jgi:hypothetical protein